VWTNEEDEQIQRGVAAGKKWKEIAAELPGRSVMAVMYHGCTRELHVSGRRGRGEKWTSEEDAIVREALGGGGAASYAAVAEQLSGRTAKGVEHRARCLGLRISGTRAEVAWTDEEDAALRRAVAEGASWREVAAALPNGGGSRGPRSTSSVYHRTCRLGLVRLRADPRASDSS
jgi:hypothetical protein